MLCKTSIELTNKYLKIVDKEKLAMFLKVMTCFINIKLKGQNLNISRSMSKTGKYLEFM